MEGQENEGVQLSSTNPTKTTGPLALRNFTIPRKKRVSGQVVLEPCPEESRDYSLIQSKLREARLDTSKEHANDWLWKDVKLVHNEDLLKEFSEKRSEMRTIGRHGREMEERFCFLVASQETTTQIYQHGLRSETQEQYSLGKPSHGVYLFRHVDVALKHAATRTFNVKNLIIFKVLLGKMKKVTPSLDWNRTPDPMVAFDCHISRDVVSHRDSLSQQVLGSSVFLFDYNENHELNKRPRQCLPYAVVSFDLAISATPPTSISPPLSPVKQSTSLTHERLRGCTVAKRRGKGENAKVIFKHFATQGCQGTDYPDYTPQIGIYGTDPTPVQYNELQNPYLYCPPHHYMPFCHTAGYFGPSLLYVDNIPYQNSYPDVSTFTSDVQLLGTKGSNTDICDVTTQSSAERISTIVYSSRLVKDPRLSRQETNIKNGSEQEKASNVSECDELRHQPHSQNQEETIQHTGSISCEKQFLQVVEEQSEDCCLKPPQDVQQEHNIHLHSKTESMLSNKLFKMKFQKYAAYLKMSEEERHKHISAQDGMTLEQKQLLIDRIHFYETYYQKYKQGELFQVDGERENALSSSSMEPKTNGTCLSMLDKSPLMKQDSTENQCHVTPAESAFTFNLTSTEALENNQRPEGDASSTDNIMFRHNGIESNSETANALKEQEHNPSSDSPEYLAEPQNRSIIKSVGDPGIPKQCLENVFLMLNNSEEREVIKSTGDFERLCSSSPSEQGEVNPQAVSSIAATGSTLSSNTEIPDLVSKNITCIDVANCVDVSDVYVTNIQEHPSAIPVELDQRCLDGTKNKDSESGGSSEMSIEVKRGELHQDNTINNVLYKRLQLDQLLPNLNAKANTSSNKSYLCPKDLDKIACINKLYSHLNEAMSKEECSKSKIQNCEHGQDLQFIVIMKSHQEFTTTERLTLSERFSKLSHLQKKRNVIVRKKQVNNTLSPNADVKHDEEGLSLSNDGEKGTRSNVKLVQLLAQRFNQARSLASCRRLGGKLSKALSKKRTNPRSLLKSLKRSAQSTTHVLKRTLYLRKKRLWKAKKICKSNANKTSQCQVLCSKSTSDPSSPRSNTGILFSSMLGSNSCLNLSAASSSPPSHNNLDSNQEDISNNSTEKHSCPNTSISANKPSHDVGFGHITDYKEKPKEVVYESVARILSDDKNKKSQGDIPSDVKNPLKSDELEPGRKTNNSCICHEEKAVPITCSGNHEPNNHGNFAKAEQKEEVTEQKTLSQANPKGWEKCDKGELDTDISIEAYDEKSSPIQVLSSIPKDITSGNKIISCPPKAKAAATTDLSCLINNEVTDMGVETLTLCDSSVDQAGNSISNSGVDIMANESSAGKTGDMDVNINIQHSSTDENDKLFLRTEESVPEQSILKTLESAEVDFVSSYEKTNGPPEPASSSQGQPPVEHTKNSGVSDSHVEGITNLHNKVVKDAKRSGIVMSGNLHSDWQGQDKNNPTTSTETQLISKLRDYLTKFEYTVKRQVPVNDCAKDSQVPMAWITLDSTIHKQQLLDTRQYSSLDLANLKKLQSDFGSNRSDYTANYMLPSTTKEKTNEEASVHNSTVVPIKRKLSKGHNPNKDYTSKRQRRSKLARVSPDSTTMLETLQNDSQTHLVVNKEMDQPHVSTSIPNMQLWMQNQGNKVQQYLTVASQCSDNIIGSSVNQPVEKAAEGNERALYDKKGKSTYIQKDYSVTDISSILKLADHAVSVAELFSLRVKCEHLLRHFISNFEQNHNISFSQSCISSSMILEKYMDTPPAPVELKFEGLNSFLELQMMVEAFQFVENKINFLSRKATFRSLLWYDPSLYGELYKGAVGFQQQSSLFSSFQKCLASEGYSKLQEYYTAVSTLHQQLQDAPDTSYYMYLKSKRERLEIEAALRNLPDVKSFFLSVPVALMINFGDSLESLEKAHHIVMTFVETPSDRLPGTFDVGKAEHLSIICRYLQEKVIFIKSNEQTNKMPWFGLEHLLYDASKLLVWRESEHGMSNEVLVKYKRSNPQIVYGVTESGLPLVNKIDQPAQLVERAQITLQQQMDGVRNYRNTQSEISTERVHSALDIHSKSGMKETHQPLRRRVTHPPLRSNLNDTPLVQPSPPAQLIRPTPYTDFPQRGSAAHWRMAGNHAWDWNPPSVVQPSNSHPEIRALLLSKRRATIPGPEPVAEIQNSHALQKQQWPLPLLMDPRAVERNNQQPTISTPLHTELRKKQTKDASALMMQSFPFTCLPSDSSVVPSPVSLQPFSNTSNQVTAPEISAPLNYPYFLFNGQTYSTVVPSVPVPVPVPGSALHAETRYHPHPV